MSVRLSAVAFATAGAVLALLVARLMLRLLAARPDNAVFGALYAATWPLVALFAPLDAGQPRFGAVLELSTLAACALLAALLAAGALASRRAAHRR